MAEAVQTRTVTTVEELKTLIGQELGHGGWFEITQADVDTFAGITGDDQWIHVDPERAKSSSFGGTIAHGLLTLSLKTMLQRNWTGIRLNLPTKMRVNYGINRVRFPAPVKVGKRIRMHTTLVSVEEPAPNVCQTVNLNRVEIEGEEKPAMVAEVITRIYL